MQHHIRSRCKSAAAFRTPAKAASQRVPPAAPHSERYANPGSVPSAGVGGSMPVRFAAAGRAGTGDGRLPAFSLDSRSTGAEAVRTGSRASMGRLASSICRKTSRADQPSAAASAKSQPGLTPRGGMIRPNTKEGGAVHSSETARMSDAARDSANSRWRSTISPFGRRSGRPASGQIAIPRRVGPPGAASASASGLQSASPAALPPPMLDSARMPLSRRGTSSAAASRVFSLSIRRIRVPPIPVQRQRSSIP